MLTIKKGGRNFYQVNLVIFSPGERTFSLCSRLRAGWFLLLVASISLTGCMDPGPRALLEGDNLLRAGKVEEAIPHLEEAVNYLPQDPRAWNYLGLAMHRAGKADKAVQHYQKALSLDRNFATARFNLGCLYLEQNDPTRAMGELITYVNLDPKKMAGWLKLGTAQLRHSATLPSATERGKMLEAARKSFEYSLTFESTPEAQNALAVIEVLRGKPRDAVRPLKAALQAEPSHSAALLNLAIVTHYYLNDPRSALPLYQTFLAADPGSNRRREVEGIARQLDAQLHPAVVATNVPTAAHPPQSAPTTAQPTNVAKARESKVETPKPAPPKAEPPVSRPAPAKAEPRPAPVPAVPPKVEVATVIEEPPVKSAQDQPVVVAPAPTPPASELPVETAKVPPAAGEPGEKEPEKKGLLQRINPTRWFRGKTNEPAPDVTALTTNQVVTPIPTTAEPKPAAPVTPPSFPRYRYVSPSKSNAGNRATAMVSFNEGMKAHRVGNASRAMESYQAAIKADPSFFEAYHNYGLAAFQAGDLTASLNAYENALAISPDSAEARYNFALALQRARYPVDAANELEKVISKQPNDVRVHLTLGNLYAQQLMQPRKARHHYEQVLFLDPQHSQAGAVRHWLKTH